MTYLPLPWAITAVICYGILALSLGYYMGRKCRACQQRKRQEAREEARKEYPIFPAHTWDEFGATNIDLSKYQLGVSSQETPMEVNDFKVRTAGMDGDGADTIMVEFQSPPPKSHVTVPSGMFAGTWEPIDWHNGMAKFRRVVPLPRMSELKGDVCKTKLTPTTDRLTDY